MKKKSLIKVYADRNGLSLLFRLGSSFLSE